MSLSFFLEILLNKFFVVFLQISTDIMRNASQNTKDIFSKL